MQAHRVTATTHTYMFGLKMKRGIGMAVKESKEQGAGGMNLYIMHIQFSVKCEVYSTGHFIS